MLVEGLKDLRVGQNGKTWCYISMIIVISFLSESLNAVGFCHYVFVKIEEYIYFLVHYNLFVCCIGHLCSLVPRPCTFVACSTCRGTNFVLQATVYPVHKKPYWNCIQWNITKVNTIRTTAACLLWDEVSCKGRCYGAYVAVPCRNQTSFCCIFQPDYCI